MLSKVVSSTIFKVFGMTRPGIEPRSPGPLANTLTAGKSRKVLYEMFILKRPLTLCIKIFWQKNHRIINKIYVHFCFKYFCFFFRWSELLHNYKRSFNWCLLFHWLFIVKNKKRGLISFFLITTPITTNKVLENFEITFYIFG